MCSLAALVEAEEEVEKVKERKIWVHEIDFLNILECHQKNSIEPFHYQVRCREKRQDILSITTQ